MTTYYDEHRVYERFSDLRVEDDVYIGLRLDGVSFSTFTKNLEKPYDAWFQRSMDAVCEALMTRIPDVKLAYVQSDEISLVFNNTSEWFGRRVEKLTSVPAALASAVMSTEMLGLALFDARALVLPALADVRIALDERQIDCEKNNVSCVMYWYLRKQGLSKRAAALTMENVGSAKLRREFLETAGVRLEPDKEFGRLLYREEYEKQGYNPVEGTTEMAVRRRLRWADGHAPLFRHMSDDTFLSLMDDRTREAV